MFCRFCGAHIADDSLFCSKCGKRLGTAGNPRIEKIVAKLRLKTPYPYFGILLLAFVIWAIGPRRTHADYTNLKWTIEVDKVLDVPKNHVYQQRMALVLENMGPSAVSNIPVDVVAHIEPAQPAEVDVDYLARRFVIMLEGKPIPLGLILSETVPSGAKRRYAIDGNIQAEPPFKVTYEVRQE